MGDEWGDPPPRDLAVYAVILLTIGASGFALAAIWIVRMGL